MPDDNSDFASELANFPDILRKLVEDELAAGNEVIGIGHSFPAPPAGAYIKLRNKVSTRPRESAGELDFYERHSSQYSGQFTDAKGFYFVLEAPDPPPDEVDMDAIRRSVNDSNFELRERPNKTDDAAETVQTTNFVDRVSKIIAPTAEGSQPFLISSTDSGRSWLVFFLDARAPYVVKELIEQKTSALLQMSRANKLTSWTAQKNQLGIEYSFELTLLATTAALNSFSLAIQADWSHLVQQDDSYCKQSSSAWVDMWTNEFQRLAAQPQIENNAELYAQHIGEALQREASEASIELIQQTVIARFKQGAIASDSHKEGGTRISWNGTHYLRVDYGDYPDKQIYSSERKFLAELLHFYSYQPLADTKLSEWDQWKLILRKLG